MGEFINDEVSRNRIMGEIEYGYYYFDNDLFEYEDWYINGE